MCWNTRTTTRVRQYRFRIARDTRRYHTCLLQSISENTMLMYMYVHNLRTQITVLIRFGTRAPPGWLVHMQERKQVLCYLRQYVDIFILVQRPSACTTHSTTPLFNKPSAATTRLSLCTEACSMYSQYNAIIFAIRLFYYTQELGSDWHQSHSTRCIMPHTSVWAINTTQTKTGYDFNKQRTKLTCPY